MAEGEKENEDQEPQSKSPQQRIQEANEARTGKRQFQGKGQEVQK